ncbi:hypothetical protein HanIR_Chr12g0572451 [Helianthus annuus]|nr:hypothetical protein HanIR_Chr12g0572451 [Helianthus annuus]
MLTSSSARLLETGFVFWPESTSLTGCLASLTLTEPLSLHLQPRLANKLLTLVFLLWLLPLGPLLTNKPFLLFMLDSERTLDGFFGLGTAHGSSCFSGGRYGQYRPPVLDVFTSSSSITPLKYFSAPNTPSSPSSNLFFIILSVKRSSSSVV